MARVTDAEVRTLIPDTSITDLDPFIAVAHSMVNKIAENCASDLTEDELKNVELYLSAHFASISDPSVALVKEKFENAENTYQTGTFGQGVLSTNFGQTADMLSGGCLSQSQKPQSQVCFV